MPIHHVDPKRHISSPADDRPQPAIVTTVPPSSGPVHGAISLTTSDTSSNCTPSDVYSRPFVLTSTGTYPLTERVELHTKADSLTYTAATTVVLKRHCSAPIASADHEKPEPCTVTGVPPSAAPRDGHTDDTAAAGRYVKLTPLDDVNCCPFSDTSTYRSPDDTDGGAEHSTWPSSM